MTQDLALMKGASSFLGEDWDPERDVSVWAGVMVVSPDDFPLVGNTKRYPNLYLNVGHGFRGTNWSLPSAALLAQAMTLPEGANEAHSLVAGVSPSRFLV